MRALVSILGALAVFALAAPARAQQWTCPNNAPVCVGPDGRIIMGGRVQGPDVHIDPNADARARAEAEARARAEAEVRRYLAWRAYLDWQAQLTVTFRAQADARLRADANARAAASWDRWRAEPIPALGRRPDMAVVYPREELGIITACGALFTSSRRALPAYGGVCVPFRHRFDESWFLALDASFVDERYANATWASLGVHPGLGYSFAHGHGNATSSHAFVRAGADLQIPLAGGNASPDAYLGGHVGVGARTGGSLGLGIELRALARGGTSSADDAAARLRVGAEIRFSLLNVAW